MIDYRLLSLQNPWWENPSSINRDPRLAEFDKLKFQYVPKSVLDIKLRSTDVNIITGPRQTGKSTAVKLYIRRLLGKKVPPETILFFSCDALSTHQDVIDLIIEFDRIAPPSPKTIFLDEITSAGNWPQAIKWLADTGLFKDKTIFLTGSSSLSLKKSGEFLPGRRGQGIDVNFLPISFPEFLALNKVETKLDLRSLIKIENYFDRFLLSGGFLRNINYGQTTENTDLYLETLRSELFKSGKKEDSLREVVRKIMSSLSSQTSYTTIAQEAELGSKNTAIEYLAFLEDSFFLIETKSYDPQQKRVILKRNKKFYTVDPYLFWLLTAFITGIDNLAALTSPAKSEETMGKLVENFVASELFKKGRTFFFAQNSRELDFYLPKENLAIEVKYKRKITSEDLKPLELAPVKSRKILVTKNILENRGDISLMPAALFSQNIQKS